MEETEGLTGNQIDRKVWLMCENLKSLEQEEMYWYERSHESWLLKGDCSTAFSIDVQTVGKEKIISSVQKKME